MEVVKKLETTLRIKDKAIGEQQQKVEGYNVYSYSIVQLSWYIQWIICSVIA
jgi:hypothetical protein